MSGKTEWIPIDDESKPNLGQEVVVFKQGYMPRLDKYWSSKAVAKYAKNFMDNSKMEFARTDESPHYHHNVTHWMPFPDDPEKVAEPEKP